MSRKRPIIIKLSVVWLCLAVAFAPVTKVPAQGPGNARPGGKKSAPVALLSISGSGEVLVNAVATGDATELASGCTLRTPATAGATVKLGDLWRIQIGPSTSLTLAYSGKRVEVELVSGCLVLETQRGARAALKTPDGESHTLKAKQPRFIDVCANSPVPNVDDSGGWSSTSDVRLCSGELPASIAQAASFSPLWLVSFSAPFAAIPFAKRGRNPSPSSPSN